MKKVDLKSTIRVIPGIGNKFQAELERMGVMNLEDLLYWFPKKYFDGTQISEISFLRHGQFSVVSAKVLSVKKKKSVARGVPMLEAIFSDGSGELLVRWFHQDYLASKLITGTSWILIGKVQRFAGETVMLSPLLEKEKKIWPIYRQTKLINTRILRGCVDWIIHNADLSQEFLPYELVLSERLTPWKEAVGQIHQPEKMSDTVSARNRFAFEEVFWFFVGLNKSFEQELGLGIKIEPDLAYIKNLIAKLAFKLTDDQKISMWQIIQDLNQDKPMVRLLNGDVGSGKTIVATLVAGVIAKAGMQTVLLVPTEVLARQHLNTIQNVLGDDFSVGIWTSSSKKGQDADVIIGTHALFYGNLNLSNIGLIIIDEQHRFGVEQRKLLISSRKDGLVPHLLSMTATPIPRTLALTVYGNLKISFIKTKPENRLPVITKIIESQQREEMYSLIRQEIGKGRVAIIICPLITDLDNEQVGPDERQLDIFYEDITRLEKKTVEKEVEKLSNPLLGLGRIAGLHGKMKAKDKLEIMEKISAGEIDVLVSTTVVEVGIDLPRATVVVVEGAENFGLAQLHQLRGRVGRNNLQSYCFLCPNKLSPDIKNRLMVLVREESGFEVSEQDLMLRGPGELAGYSQSGLPDFHFASFSDIDYLLKVKQLAEDYCKKIGKNKVLEIENRYFEKNKILE